MNSENLLNITHLVANILAFYNAVSMITSTSGATGLMGELAAKRLFDRLQQHREDCAVEVRDRSQALCFPFVVRLSENDRKHLVQQVHCVILRLCLIHDHESKQGRNATVKRHASDGLGFRRRSITSQGLDRPAGIRVSVTCRFPISCE